MTLDELDALLTAQAAKAKEVNLPSNKRYILKCRRCTTSWNALYHGPCLTCNADRFTVEIVRVEDLTPLPLERPERKVADMIMTVTEYLRKECEMSATELVRMKRSTPDEFTTLIMLAKAEMRDKGIQIIGQFA